MVARDLSPSTEKATREPISRAAPNAEPAGLTVDQLSGDLLCPLCGEPLEIRMERTEYGVEPVGACAECVTLVDNRPMTLIEPYATSLANALKAHAEAAAVAQSLSDLDDIRRALRLASDSRIIALELLAEGEAKTRRQALADMEKAA